MKFPVIIVVIFTILAMGSPAVATPANQASNVLFVFSAKQGMPWEQEVRKGFSSALATSSQDVNLFFEYMDNNRFHAESHAETFKSYLTQKYAGFPLDYVVYQGFSVSQIIQSSPELFPKAHKIFLNPGPRLPNHALKNTSVIRISADFDRAARELLAINPGKTLYLVTGATPGAQIRLTAFNDAVAKYDPDRPVVTLAGLPLEELQAQTANLPRESAIVFLLLFQDKEGKRYTPYRVAEQLSQTVNAPMFSVWTPLLGSGIVGGYLLSGELVGEKIAATIVKNRAVQESDKDALDDIHGFFFDWRKLQQWEIDESRLPTGSRILFKEKPYYVDHFLELTLGALGLIIFISFFWIFALKKQIQARLRTEKKLIEKENKYRCLSNAAFEGIMLCSNGVIVETNLTLPEMFDFNTTDNLTGKNITELFDPSHIDDVIQDIQSEELASTFANGRKKSGALFPVEIKSRLLSYKKEKVRVVVVRDLTAQKKAEEEIKTLQGILPICMHCKEIRNDEGYWVQLETYISTHSMAEFSHGVCNKCAQTYYPGILPKNQEENS